MLDPQKMADWQIAEEVERTHMIPIQDVARSLGIMQDEIIPMGRNLAKIDYAKVLRRVDKKPLGKYVIVTAMTPTPLGEGKTTTTIGLIQGLGKLGKKVVGAIRQPSAGPTFNIKGSAAGGGLSQCIPMAPFSIRLTGDIDSITNAHNLCMVALNARMQHERNYDDKRLLQTHMRRLQIDPQKVVWKWAMDFCAQSLRHITIGKGGSMDGFEMDSGFQISVSSEIMAILSMAKNLKDFRERMAKIVVAYDVKGNEITTRDLEVDGAMTAWMVDALFPNLLQTLEGQPVFVHAGPFANIALGQSSIIADYLGVKLGEYHVTECGFGADIGYEKFWDVKCAISGLKPDAVVVVATIRSLKMHGGGPEVKPGIDLDPAYQKENLPWVEKGCENLLAHVRIVKKSGIQPIVCLNSFPTDTKREQAIVRRLVENEGGILVISDHWKLGGEGALDLAKAVVDASTKKNDFHPLYREDLPLQDKIETIAKEIYGATSVFYEEKALIQLKKLMSDKEISSFGVCMVKTHLSLSHDPSVKGFPGDFILPIRDILVYKGAKLIVPVTGNIQLMPGTSSNPGFRRIDVDVETGRVTGLF